MIAETTTSSPAPENPERGISLPPGRSSIHTPFTLGEAWGLFTMISTDEGRDANGRTLVKARCECGETKVLRGSHLRDRSKYNDCGDRAKHPRKSPKPFTKAPVSKIATATIMEASWEFYADAKAVRAAEQAGRKLDRNFDMVELQDAIQAALLWLAVRPSRYQRAVNEGDYSQLMQDIYAGLRPAAKMESERYSIAESLDPWLDSALDVTVTTWLDRDRLRPQHQPLGDRFLD